MAKSARNQPKLDLTFEGEEVASHSLKLAGSPEAMFKPEPKGSPVAFLVLGTVDKVGFTDDDAGRLQRQQNAKMLRAIELPYGKAIEIFDQVDRERLEEQGIKSLFDGITSAISSDEEIKPVSDDPFAWAPEDDVPKPKRKKRNLKAVSDDDKPEP